jgi:hypothetical protein
MRQGRPRRSMAGERSAGASGRELGRARDLGRTAAAVEVREVEAGVLDAGDGLPLALHELAPTLPAVRQAEIAQVLSRVLGKDVC